MLGQTKSSWRFFPPSLAQENCSICQGTGWEMVHSEGSATARRCPCVALSRTARLRYQIRIPDRSRHCTLENYHPATLAQMRGLAEAWRFVESFPNAERGLIFVGGSGLGKTHLAVGIVMELAERFQEDSLFADFRSLPDTLWSLGGSGGSGSPAGARLRTVSLLVLDNFGPGMATDNHHVAALRILHARLRARRPTLCTGPGLNGDNTVSVDRLAHTGRSAAQQVQALLMGGFKIVSLEDSQSRHRKPFLSGLF